MRRSLGAARSRQGPRRRCRCCSRSRRARCARRTRRRTSPARASGRTRGSRPDARTRTRPRRGSPPPPPRRVSASRSVRAKIPASGTGRPVSPSHHSPRSATATRPWSRYVKRLSWMISPASTSPATTAARISSYRSSTTSPSAGAARRRRRNAVVSRPGTAIRPAAASASDFGSRATTSGPTPRPSAAPLRSSR